MSTIVLIVGVLVIIFLGCALAWAMTYYSYKWMVQRRINRKLKAYIKGEFR